MSDYYNVVAGCLEASRNGRFCVGAEDAAVEIDALRKACGVKERELLELRGKLEASEHMLTIWRDAEAKRREGDHFEVRLDDDGALDEIVGSGAFHIEQMDTNSWFVEVGGCALNVHGKSVKLVARDYENWQDAKRSSES